MDQVQFYERKPIAKAAVKSAELISNTVNSWVNRVILIALQVTVTICVFEGLRDLIPKIVGPGYNIILSAVACGVVMFCTYVILLKYQSLIQQLGRQNDNLEEALEERISELEKTNEAMRQELSGRKRGE
jgi:C4-dicarboxylate-specific signal transduction histidine kinase